MVTCMCVSQEVNPSFVAGAGITVARARSFTPILTLSLSTASLFSMILSILSLSLSPSSFFRISLNLPLLTRSSSKPSFVLFRLRRSRYARFNSSSPPIPVPVLHLRHLSFPFPFHRPSSPSPFLLLPPPFHSILLPLFSCSSFFLSFSATSSAGCISPDLRCLNR